jgi:polyhydroxyalkanoate synthesis repressor PhaR
MTPKDRDSAEQIIIKKYANRRLYNTATSSYVTLETLAEMVRDGVDFIVVDAKTGEDITRPVLTQIIVEQENKGQNLLPIRVLRQLIGMYGDSMQWLLPGYLEAAMDSFARNQERMRAYLQNTFGGIFPFEQLDRMGKQNMAMFEQVMKMFLPRVGENAETRSVVGNSDDHPRTRETKDPSGTLSELEARIAELQREIDSLSRRRE